MFVVALFAAGCSNAPEGSTCLQLWNEFGPREVSDDLLCADYVGEQSDEMYPVYIFTESGIQSTDPDSFELVDTFEVVLLVRKGEYIEVDCPSEEIAYMCIDELDEGLFFMGPTIGPRHVTMFDGEVRTLLCAYSED